MVPSESVPDPVNATTSGALPDVGVAVALAVGGWLTGALTVMPTLDELVAPLLSVTVRVAV